MAEVSTPGALFQAIAASEEFRQRAIEQATRRARISYYSRSAMRTVLLGVAFVAVGVAGYLMPRFAETEWLAALVSHALNR